MITLPGSGNFRDYPVKVEIKDIKKRGNRSTEKPSKTATAHEQITAIQNSEKYNMMMVQRQTTSTSKHRARQMVAKALKKNNFKPNESYMRASKVLNSQSKGSFSPSRTSSMERKRADETQTKKKTMSVINSLSNLGAFLTHQPLG